MNQEKCEVSPEMKSLIKKVKITLGDFVECCKIFKYFVQRRRKHLRSSLNLLRDGLKVCSTISSY